MGSDLKAMITSTEISALWTQFMSDSMSICFSKYALETLQDREIKEIYETALSISKKQENALKGPLL